MLATPVPNGYPTPVVSLDAATFWASLGNPQFDEAVVITRSDALVQFQQLEVMARQYLNNKWLKTKKKDSKRMKLEIPRSKFKESIQMGIIALCKIFGQPHAQEFLGWM